MARVIDKAEFENSLLNVNTQSSNSALKQIDGEDLIDYVKSDFVGDDIPFTPTGNITANTLEDAVIQLDALMYYNAMKSAYYFR